MYVIFMNLIENNQVHNSYYCFFLHKFFFYIPQLLSRIYLNPNISENDGDWCRWEQGIRNFPVLRFYKLSSAFSVSPLLLRQQLSTALRGKPFTIVFPWKLDVRIHRTHNKQCLTSWEALCSLMTINSAETGLARVRDLSSFTTLLSKLSNVSNTRCFSVKAVSNLRRRSLSLTVTSLIVDLARLIFEWTSLMTSGLPPFSLMIHSPVSSMVSIFLLWITTSSSRF